MTRLDTGSPEGIERIKIFIQELERLAEDIKNRQISGTESLKFYQSDTGNSYDWSGTLPTAGQSYGSRAKILLFTATAGEQESLYGDIIVEVYKNNLSTPYSQFSYYEAPVNLVDRKKKQWYVVVVGNDTATYFVKVYVVANDSVTITYTEIN